MLESQPEAAKGRVVIGDHDETLENNLKFDAHLTQLEIPHALTVKPVAPPNMCRHLTGCDPGVSGAREELRAA